jgi:hypothetical protein
MVFAYGKSLRRIACKSGQTAPQVCEPPQKIYPLCPLQARVNKRTPLRFRVPRNLKLLATRFPVRALRELFLRSCDLFLPHVFLLFAFKQVAINSLRSAPTRLSASALHEARRSRAGEAAVTGAMANSANNAASNDAHRRCFALLVRLHLQNQCALKQIGALRLGQRRRLLYRPLNGFIERLSAARFT